MKDALKNSLKTEQKHVEERFTKADGIFSVPVEKIEPKVQLKEVQEEKKPLEQVIRDTFSMPKKDGDLITEVRLRCMRAGIDTTRSEIVRAGIRHLANLPANELCKLIETIEKLKPGPQKQEKR